MRVFRAVGSYCLFCIAAMPAYAGLTVVSSSAQRCELLWRCDSAAVSADGTISIIGAETNTKAGDSGQFVLPAYRIHAGVPLSGDIQVRVEQPVITAAAAEHPVNRWRKYRGRVDAPIFDGPWISRPCYSWMRGRRVAALCLRPIDISATSVRCLTAARIIIDFPSATAAAGPPPVASDYEAMLRRLVVNYDVACRWTRPPGLSRRASSPRHPLTFGSFLVFSIGDGDTGFAEGTVRENGLYRLTASDIAGLGSALPIERIHLYAAHKSELPWPAPEIGRIPDGVVEVPAMRADMNNNGVLDAEDCLLFYATGASDWEYEASGAGGSWEYNLDRYENFRRYWVTVGPSAGKSMGRFSPPRAPPADTQRSFVDHQLWLRPLAQPDKINEIHSYEGGCTWIWRKLTRAQPDLDFMFNPAGATRPADVRIRWSGLQYYATASLSVDDMPVCSGCLKAPWQAVPAAAGGGQDGLRIRLSAQCDADTDFVYVQTIEASWRSALDMQGRSCLTIYSRPEIGAMAYELSGVRDSLYLLRIPADESGMTILDPSIDSANGVCRWVDTAGIGVRYLVCARSMVRVMPAAGVLVASPADSGALVRTLRETHASNYLIVTSPEFLGAARALADHKRKSAAFASPSPAIVLMTDVYREFSGGCTDPAAARNFLAYAQQNWTNGLEYVLLLGAGHWDYKARTSREPMFVPVAEPGGAFNETCADEYFACLDPGESERDGPDIMLGRITCTTPGQAQDAVDKIREMEDPALADFGAWRNTVLLVADDDRQGRKIDYMGHHSYSDQTAVSIAACQPAAIIRKVYLFEYAFNELMEKPDAARAIINEINDGVSIINWFGHGSPDLWADEHVLTSTGINGLTNRGRYPLVCSFSCSVGQFDRPGHASLSDRLVLLPGAGAIAAIAATRTSGYPSNQSLASAVYRALFDTAGSISLGAAWRVAMAGEGAASGQYVLLGDPSIRFVHNLYRVRLSVTDVFGRPIDTLRALSTVTIRGEVGGFATAPDSFSVNRSFGSTAAPAQVRIGLYNPDDTAQRKDGMPEAAAYTLPGTPLFAGQAPVTGGVFAQTILIPRNVAFEKQGVRLSAFAWQGPADATGFKGDIIFSGTDATPTDSAGPAIAVRPVYADSRRNSGAAFADHVSLALPGQLEIIVSDRDGIDAAGTGPDEGLSLEIPGCMSVRNVNHAFRFARGGYQSGAATISFEEGSIRPGSYTLRVTAHDLLGNSTRAEFGLEISNTARFSLDHVFNYPNPMRAGASTRFYCYPSSSSYSWQAHDEISVKVCIYSMSGKLLRVIRPAAQQPQNGIAWDGTDEIGNSLGPNIYLYRIYADDQSRHEQTKSAIRKLVIHPPR